MTVAVRLASGVGPQAGEIFDYGGAGYCDVDRNGGVAGCPEILGRSSREGGERESEDKVVGSERCSRTCHLGVVFGGT